MNYVELLIFALMIAVSSFFAIRAYLKLAIDKQILDVPNERSSHSVPTPRGGGVAFSIICLIGLLLLSGLHTLQGNECIAIASSGFVVVIGYMDDRKGLSILSRLAVQCLASLVAVIAIMLPMLGVSAGPNLRSVALLAALTIALMWSTNLTNFMDGIDGLAAIQLTTVALTIAILIMCRHGVTTSAVEFIILAASISPFLIFNWSPAKMFMGDAGSGFLGFIVCILAMIAVLKSQISAAVPFIIFCVFIVDATNTLLIRMFTGQRWHQAHRLHAFQILADRLGHKTVSTCVGLVNLAWLAPLSFAAEFDRAHGLAYTTIAYIPVVAVCYLTGAGIPKALRNRSNIQRPRLVDSDKLPDGIGLKMPKFIFIFGLAVLSTANFICSYISLNISLSLLKEWQSISATLIECVIISILQTTIVYAFCASRQQFHGFISLVEMPESIGAALIGLAVGVTVAEFFIGSQRMTLASMTCLMSFCLSSMALVGLSLVGDKIASNGRGRPAGMASENALICGSNLVGLSLLEQIGENHPNLLAVGFIDEQLGTAADPIRGLRILGGHKDIDAIVQKYSISHIFISNDLQPEIPIEDLYKKCNAQNIQLHVVPSLMSSSSMGAA